jgi:hypothetical protein
VRAALARARGARHRYIKWKREGLRRRDLAAMGAHAKMSYLAAISANVRASR